MLRSSIAVALLLLCVPVCAAQGQRLELADGERVVLLGNAFFERDVQAGHFEMALTLAHPDKTITFRNLGWSGDTVWGHARAGFGSVADGYQNLLRQVRDAKPTTLFLCYGTSEAFAGPEGLPKFIAQYNKLLDDLKDTNARLVLVTPLKLEKLPPPLPDPAARNSQFAQYADALKQLAAARNAVFFDLFNAQLTPPAGSTLTANGLHLTDAGARVVAQHVAALCSPEGYNGSVQPGLAAALQQRAEKAGPKLEQLRALIVEKNTLFFHRWRPQNDTYIFGFRKREQGRNAVDIPKFDPLVEAKEKEIAALRAELK